MLFDSKPTREIDKELSRIVVVLWVLGITICVVVFIRG